VVTAFDDGFIGNNPEPAPGEPEGPGWGCDSNREGRWQPSALDDWIKVPSCIPQQDGTGPFRDSSVPWSSTIMHRMDEGGLSWGLYVPTESMTGYTRAICPSLADCIYGGQAHNVYPPFQFQDDIAAGLMPALSILSPSGPNSQHNDWSMAQGDNWIGDIVSSVVDSQYWDSTAIFITYDDCGCFYDHVPPPADLGIRVPMVIVSPFAKAGYTDTKTASYAGMLAYVEHTFGLAPMSSEDADAYDFNKSFNYSQPPLPGISMRTTKVPQWELDYIEAHPPDDDDPT
jgi:phospholipase C